MSKKLNKHYFREKEYRNLLSDLDENETAQNNLGYIDIEPIPRGFNAYFILRKDVQNREDAWVFQYIIDMGAVTAWRHKNTFFHKESKSYNRKDKDGDQHPYFRGINEETYNSLPPQVKKWFSMEIGYKAYDHGWGKNWYHHHVPYFFFETEVVQSYITKKYIIDEILIQEEKEIRRKIRNLNDLGVNIYGYDGHGTVPKEYIKSYNGSHRAREKQAIHNFMNDKNYDFPGRHRHSASYNYW